MRHYAICAADGCSVRIQLDPFVLYWLHCVLSFCFCRLDLDGSVVRQVAPSKPPGPYLITSRPDWWKLDAVNSWQEPRFGGEQGPVWVNPMPANEMVARLEMRVATSGGAMYTQGEWLVYLV